MEALSRGAGAVREQEAADDGEGGAWRSGGSIRSKPQRLKVPVKAKGVFCFSAFNLHYFFNPKKKYT